MIRIAIIEDDTNDLENLQVPLEQYLKDKNKEYKISTYSSSESFLSAKEEIDVVFADINLPNEDGMSAMKKLRREDQNTIIVFVTNLVQFALEGYEVNAFDFIVKPVSKHNLYFKLDRIMQRLRSRKDKTIWITTRAEKKKVLLSELKYVEVVKHKIIYHCINETITIQGAMKNVIEELKDYSFSLCNQCYLVNLAFVTGIDNNFCVIGEEKLLISSPKKKEFLRALNDYLASGAG